MNKKTNKERLKKEEIEDTTEYGEFITTYNKWLTPKRQKEIAKNLEDITKK